MIPLNQIVQIKEVPDVAKINHYKGTRSISIYADNNNEMITPLELNQQIRDFLQPFADKYIDAEIIFGGEEKATQESLQSLMIAMGLALLGIYFILVILFNSFGQPFIVMIKSVYLLWYCLHLFSTRDGFWFYGNDWLNWVNRHCC